MRNLGVPTENEFKANYYIYHFDLDVWKPRSGYIPATVQSIAVLFKLNS